jgi:hypothetical protein
MKISLKIQFKLVLLAIGFFGIASLVIGATSAGEALIHDAQSYYNEAISVAGQGIFPISATSNANFIDRGYPLALSLGIKIFGLNNIVALQILNYIFWILSSWLVYLSLVKINSKYPSRLSLLMLFSPLFMTFSAKIYSEPYATFGLSLLIYSVVHLLDQEKFIGHLSLLFGAFILFSTKSIFILFVPIILIVLLLNKRWIGILYLTISITILSPFLLSSSKGGRSIYNLAIQSSKLEQSYDQIFACVPYYLSYPLGKTLLPKYEAVCHQNDPNPQMDGYDSNPYVLASAKRETGFNYFDWLKLVITHPIKYTIVILVSLSNIVFFEGVYPTILIKLPMLLMLPLFVICKIILSIYLWSRVLVVAKKENKWWLLPLIYFVIIVTNFPIESRYFYPLIPYIYFLAGFSYKKV